MVTQCEHLQRSAWPAGSCSHRLNGQCPLHACVRACAVVLPRTPAGPRPVPCARRCPGSPPPVSSGGRGSPQYHAPCAWCTAPQSDVHYNISAGVSQGVCVPEQCTFQASRATLFWMAPRTRISARMRCVQGHLFHPRVNAWCAARRGATGKVAGKEVGL